MICPICKQEIKDDSRFCSRCGKKIPRCPTCGKVFYKKSRFCIHDGTPVPEDIFCVFEETAQQVPNTVEAERFRKIKLRSEKRKKFVSFAATAVLFILIGGAVGCIVFHERISLKNQINNSRNSVFSEEMPENESDGEDTKPADDIMVEEFPEEDQAPEKESPAEAVVSEDNSVDIDEESVSDESTDAVLYFIMHSDSKYFTEKDLEDFDADMCRIARNGIYALMGRKFSDEKLTAYFEKYDWYEPVIEPEDFSDSFLNAYQIANRDLIVAFEEEHGYR